jgi:DNA-directed RNA polymerase specialized sigma24 family protein
MTLRADVVEGLVNDTMLEVWKAGESIRTNASVLVAIMRLAYSRAQKYIADAGTDEPHCQRDVHDCEQSKSTIASPTPSGLQFFLSRLPVEERTAVYLVHASGCSRRETADVMKISCDDVDVLLRGVRASATLYYSVPSAHSR